MPRTSLVPLLLALLAICFTLSGPAGTNASADELQAVAEIILTPEQKAALAAVDARLAGVEALATKIEDANYRADVVRQLDDMKKRRLALEKNFDPASYETLMHSVITRYQVTALWLKQPALSAPPASALPAIQKTPIGKNGRADLREIRLPPEPPADSVIAIVGARLIDGRGGEPVENAVVVVHASKISAVGPESQVTIPSEAVRVDAHGLSVLPGLIDSHFHSKNDIVRPVEYQLKHGITTFRDPGHPFHFYDAVRSAEATMPRVFLCGGHLEAYPPAWPEDAVVITDANHARRTVNEHVDAGASAIKVYMRLPLEHISAACEAAANRGVLVTAHLELVDADAAIRAGVRGIEHVTSFGTTLAESAATEKFKAALGADSEARHALRFWLWSTIDLDASPRVKPLLELVVREGVFVSPTLAIFEKRSGEKGASDSDLAGFANMLRFVGLCHRAGAKVVVGSHTSAPHAEVGRAYQRELELLVDAGLTPREAITAGTLRNAQFFGVAERLGTIEPGKLADLILIQGDPSRDIREMKHVRRVMLNGVWQREPNQ